VIGQTALTLADGRSGPFAESVVRWQLGDVAGIAAASRR